MKKYLRNTLAGCAVMLAALTGAQATWAADVSVTSAASPRACVLANQPVEVTLSNTGTDTATVTTFGVIKNGVKLFEEKKTVKVSGTVTVTLDGTIDLDYGKTETVKIYAKGDVADDNAANDTLTLNLTMPAMKDFPYSYNHSDFGVSKFSYDEANDRYYIVGRGTNLRNAQLTTPGVNMAAGDKAKFTFNYHVSTAYLTLLVVADYGSSLDTLHNQHIDATGDGFADKQLSFTAKGPAQVYVRITGAPSTSYSEFIVSQMSVIRDEPDLAATAVVSPSVSTLVRQDAGYKVGVTYTNRSSFDITNPTFGYTAGTQTVTETYSGTIAAGENVTYTFGTALTAPTAIDSCEVVAWCKATGDSNAANDTVKKVFHFYDAQSFPYITKFEEGNDLWQVINADGDNYSWTFSSLSATGGCAYYALNTNASSEDYLVSPAISMPAGRSRVSFYYSGTQQAGTECLTVLLSTTPDASGVVKPLFTKYLTNNGWLTGYSPIDIDEAGVYYVLFRATGRGDRIYIDNLYIDRDEDLCINDVTTDAQSGYGLTTTKVTLSFMNYGVSAQSDVKVRYYINNVVADEQTVPGTVQPGDTVYCTFEKAADISTPDSTYQFKGEIATVLGPDQTNDVIYGQSVTNWAVKTLPYTYGFDDTERNGQWLFTTDTEGAKSGWAAYSNSSNSYSPNYVLRHYGIVSSGNDWAISECIYMPKGRYTVSFFYRTPVNMTADTYKQDFGFYLGNGRTPEAMTTQIVTFEDMINSGQWYKKYVGEIEITEDGQYYLGFNCNTRDCRSSASLWIEDVSVLPIAKGQALPYTAAPTTDNGWTRYNPRRSNPYWQAYTEADGTTVMRVERTKSHADLSSGFEDKLVSPTLSLEDGRSVKVTVNYALSSDSANTAINMSAGHIDNSAELSTVASMPVVADSAYTDYVYTFTATAADSVFYLGFRTNTPEGLTTGYRYDARIKTVTLEYDGDTGIDGVAAAQGVRIAAQGGTLTVAAPATIGGVELYDLMGRKVMSANSQTTAATFDCSGLSGIYIVRAAGSVKKVQF